MTKQQPLTLDQRRAILQREINGHLNRGFRVQSQTETTAQLVKPKRFSLLWAVLWFFVFGVGLVLYLLYYLSKKDETVYLEVGEAGQVKRIGAGGLSGGGLRLFGFSSTGTLILCGGCLALSIILTLVNGRNEPAQTQAATAIAAATDAAPTKKPSTPIPPAATLEPAPTEIVGLLPGLNPTKITASLHEIRFDCSSAEFVSGYYLWSCKRSDSGVDYIVYVYGRTLLTVDLIDSSVVQYGEPSDEVVMSLFGPLAAVSYDGAEPEKARGWVEKTLPTLTGKSGDVRENFFGNVRFALYGVPTGRFLEIGSVEP